MLVLTRKPNQSIVIGESITINVVKVRGNTVQLGIAAPKEVRVMRSELVDGSAAEKRDANQHLSVTPQPSNSATQKGEGSPERKDSKSSRADVKDASADDLENEDEDCAHHHFECELLLDAVADIEQNMEREIISFTLQVAP